LISSVSTLPIIEFLPYSKRFLGGVGAISGNESVPMEFFNLVRVHFKDLIGIILPSYSNIGIGVIYFGVTPVLLTFYAIYKFWRRNHLVLFLSLLMIFALVYSLGIVIPYIFHEIPFVNRIRQPQKYLTVIAFVIPILAGFGLNSIFNFINEEKK